MSQKKSGGKISAPFCKPSPLTLTYPLALIEFLLAILLLTAVTLIFQANSHSQKQRDIENQLVNIRIELSNIHGLLTR